MDIRLNIELRCARRKMMRHTSIIVAVPSQADTRSSSIGVTWSTNALGACSSALDCKTAAESWSDRASFPGKRERSAQGGRVLWATGCDAHAGTRRVPTVASTSRHAFGSQIWPFRLQIWIILDTWCLTCGTRVSSMMSHSETT